MTTDTTVRRTKIAGAVTALVVMAAVLAVGLTTARAGRRGETFPRLDLSVDAENPTRGAVTAQTTEDARLRVTVRDDEGVGYTVTTPDLGREHEAPLLQLYPEGEFEVLLEAVDESGEVLGDTTQQLTTPALDALAPPLNVTAAEPDRMQPGITLFNGMYRAPGEEEAPQDEGFLFATDHRGNLVWYQRTPHGIEDATPIDNGNLLVGVNETGVYELTPTGEKVREWSGTNALDDVPEDQHGRTIVGEDAIRVETESMHHDIHELSNGNFITLSREVREIEYPEPICDEEEYPFDGTYDVVGDTIVEFVPATGEIVREYSMFDVLDPVENLDDTVTSEFCGRYLNPQYDYRWPVHDWSHANAVTVLEEHNEVHISLRHEDQIVALRYEDDEEGEGGELLWRLGEGGDFELEGDGEWFLHQHAQEWQPDGSVLIYDNANRRNGPDTDDPSQWPQSRAVRYEIDRENMTARQVWEHTFPPEEGVYAPFVGDADATEAGTVLIAHTGLLDPPSHNPVDGNSQLYARFVEVDEETGDIVFDLNTQADDGAGWGGYRAERIPTLYPAEYEYTALPAGN